MRSFILFTACLYLIVCFTRCNHKEKEHEIYTKADSLIGLTMALQSRIGSPEIQRMHEFQEEIIEDLSKLMPVPEEDTSYIKYQELYNGLGQCLQSCSRFHEEAYMLETSLREIMVQIHSKEADPEKLYEQLQLEIDNYENLSARFDSSMSLAILNAEIFYSLKPGIDRMKEVISQVPDPMP